MYNYDNKLIIVTSEKLWYREGDIIYPLSIDMGARKGDMSADNVAVDTPYFLFPYNNSIQRFYQTQVQDFGIDLPYYYQGEYVDVCVIPGAVLAAVSANNSSWYSPGFSGVYCYRSNAWHPIMSLDANTGLNCCYYQWLPNGQDILWAASGNWLYCMDLPRTWNLYDYMKANTVSGITALYQEYTLYLYTGQYLCGTRKDKRFQTITPYTPASGGSVNALFMLAYKIDITKYDIGLSLLGYTKISITNLSATNGVKQTVGVSGSNIAFLMTLYAPSEEYINGFDVEYFAVSEVTAQWQPIVEIADFQLDLKGVANPNSYYDTYSLLETWSESASPLTLNALDASMDGKSVHVNLISKRLETFEEKAVVANKQQRYKAIVALAVYKLPS